MTFPTEELVKELKETQVRLEKFGYINDSGEVHYALDRILKALINFYEKKMLQ